MTTINADNFSFPNKIPNGGTNVTSVIPYTPIVSTGTGDQFVSVNASPTGYILRSQGNMAPPAFTPGPALVLLDYQQNLVSATGTFNVGNTVFTDNYTVYLVIVSDMVNITTNTTGLYIRYLDNAAPQLPIAAGYDGGCVYSTVSAAGSLIALNSTNNSRIVITQNVAAATNNRRVFSKFYLFRPIGGSSSMVVSGATSGVTRGIAQPSYMACGLNSNAMFGIQVGMSNPTGTISSTVVGKIAVYGVKT